MRILLMAAVFAALSAPALASDAGAYLAGKNKAELQNQVRQSSKILCRAQADGLSMVQVMACAREGESQASAELMAADRTNVASAR